MQYHILGDSILSTKGQIVIPVEVRKKLHLEPGANIVFLTDDSGHIYLELKESIQLEKQKAAFKQSQQLLKEMDKKYKKKEKINVMKDFRDDGY